MTVGAGIAVQDGSLVALGAKILREVRGNVHVTPAAGGGLTNGAFLGVRSAPAGSRSVFPVGKLRDLRFMCTFRFKMWWMTQRMGSSGRDIPFETQFLIVEGTDGPQFTSDSTERPVVYTVFLPILEGSFRAVLQGNADDELEICLESGDPDVESFEGTHLVFVGAGSDPFEVITNSVKAVERHLQTFSHREKKKMPDILNWFGWCTWDAFYTNVTAEGVKEGLQSFQKGGVSPKFVIIDDGWQSVGMDPVGIACLADNSANFANRLTHIKENHKFQKNGREGHREDDPAKGLAHIVSEIKGKHELKYVYVWHAITGYWGGVRPGVVGMEQYESKMQHPVSSPGVQKNEPCDALNSITTNGLGLVNPEKVFSFYNELHSYLASAGIDGVKVDVQNILETLGAGHGGRVLLARKYQQALEASIARNFPDNGIISCMSHNTDNLYSSKRSAVVRASDDFWPRDPASHFYILEQLGSACSRGGHDSKKNLQHSMVNLRFPFTPPAHHCSSKYLPIHLLPDASFPLCPVPAPLRAPPRRRLLRLPRAPPRRRRLRLPHALPTTSPSSCARALSAPALPLPAAVVSPSPIPPPLAGEARGGGCSDGSALTSFSGEPRSDMAVASTEQPPASLVPSSLPMYARAVAAAGA